MDARYRSTYTGNPTTALQGGGKRLSSVDTAAAAFHEVMGDVSYDLTPNWYEPPFYFASPSVISDEGDSEGSIYEGGTACGWPFPAACMQHPSKGAPLPVHLQLLNHPLLSPDGPELTIEEAYPEPAFKRLQHSPSKNRPLARSLLCPVPPTESEAKGSRRRGRPVGSGNRHRMSPQRVGRDGTRRFSMRSANFTGVYMTPRGKWRAQISHQRKVVQLGMYLDEQAAAHRWDIEAIRLRGHSTQLNFPELKSLYLTLIGKVLRSTEGREMNLSALFNEAMIRREIQDHTERHHQTKGCSEEESELSSGHSSLGCLAGTSPTQLTIEELSDGPSTPSVQLENYETTTPFSKAPKRCAITQKTFKKSKKTSKSARSIC